MATHSRLLITKHSAELLPVFVEDNLILIGAYLLSIQMRLTLPFGSVLGLDYQAHQPGFYIFASLALVIAYAMGRLCDLSPVLARWLNLQRRFRMLMLAVILTTIFELWLNPEMSQLQLAYFVLCAFVIGAVIIVLPRRAQVSYWRFRLSDHLAALYRRRHLIALWFNYNLKARYSQTILGVLWIVLLPLSTSAVLGFAFSNFLQVDSDVPYFSFFLAALLPFSFFSNTLHSGMHSVSGMMNVVNQIYFPREILVLLKVMEGLVDFFFTFLAMILINLLLGIAPTPVYLLLVAPFAILIIFTLALALITSCFSILVRDLPQLVSVILQLLFYVSPVLYALDKVPEKYQFLASINPLATIIQSFRDIIIYQRSPDMVQLLYPFVLSLTLLYTGYWLFKGVEKKLPDLI